MVFVVIEFLIVGLAFSMILILLLHRYLFPVQNRLKVSSDADITDVKQRDDKQLSDDTQFVVANPMTEKAVNDNLLI